MVLEYTTMLFVSKTLYREANGLNGRSGAYYITHTGRCMQNLTLNIYQVKCYLLKSLFIFLLYCLDISFWYIVMYWMDWIDGFLLLTYPSNFRFLLKTYFVLFYSDAILSGKKCITAFTYNIFTTNTKREKMFIRMISIGFFTIKLSYFYLPF